MERCVWKDVDEILAYFSEFPRLIIVRIGALVAHTQADKKKKIKMRYTTKKCKNIVKYERHAHGILSAKEQNLNHT